MTTTTNPQAGPVSGGDHWRQACAHRHWHLFAEEATGRTGDPSPPKLELEGRAEQAVAGSPEEVLAWMRAQLDRVAPRATRAWKAQLERALNPDLEAIHLAALSWGKGTGMGVRLTDSLSLRLLAVPAGSKTDLPGQVSCTKPHRS